jgi:hypothetical protein
VVDLVDMGDGRGRVHAKEAGRVWGPRKHGSIDEVDVEDDEQGPSGGSPQHGGGGLGFAVVQGGDTRIPWPPTELVDAEGG